MMKPILRRLRGLPIDSARIASAAKLAENAAPSLCRISNLKLKNYLEII